MADMETHARLMYRDATRFFDNWNLIGLAGVIVISIIAFFIGDFSPQSVLVSVTALYAYIAFNQMRESRWSRRPANPLSVRPHFQQDNEDGAFDFGLKNFGDSPALNLRLRAILREGTDKANSMTVSARNRHLHLEEDGFHPLTAAAKQQGFGDLTDSEDPVFENYEQKSIELYYTFEANDGTQYPRNWKNPMELGWNEVIEKSDSPRTVELAEIRERCT